MITKIHLVLEILNNHKHSLVHKLLNLVPGLKKLNDNLNLLCLYNLLLYGDIRQFAFLFQKDSVFKKLKRIPVLYK